MQKYQMYTIRDSKGEMYNLPMLTKNQPEAERHFTRLAKDQQSMISQFPEDYDLYYIGEFDDSTGCIKSLETPNHIIKATSVINR